MTKDRWDKFKISSDALKANWPILLLALTALSSGITNASQYITNSDQEAEKNEAIREVAIGFQNAITEPVKPIAGKRCDCNAAIKRLISQHERQHKSDH